jgi:AcrR family transcriptional regulator
MLVDATLPLLIAQGEKVTTRQIADAAGVAEGTIFRVFADKDELIEAVVEKVIDTAALEQAIAAIDPSQPLEDRVTAAVEILRQRTVDIWRLVSSVGTRFHNSTRRPVGDSPALIDLFEHDRERLGVEPVMAARVLRAFTLSLTHPMLVDEPATPSEIVAYLFNGIDVKERSC